jgi:predicted MFS family arabinose efflux permease
MLTLLVPAIQNELDATQAQIGLMTSISALMLSAFILAGGTLGDLYGRKRFMLLGTGGMVLAAVLCTVVPGANALIAVRALDGVCQALVNPLALAVLAVTFDDEERPKALGIYGASLGIMGGLSSLAIQFLNQSFGWRAVFGLTIVLGVATMLMVWRLVPESRASSARRPDWGGIGLCAVGLFALVYGISQASGPAGPFSLAVGAPLLIAVVFLSVFIWWEGRTESPALELSLFRSPAFSLGCVLVLALSFGQVGVFFHLSNYFQVLLERSPLSSALMLLPLTLSLFLFSIAVGMFASRFAPRVLIAGGTALFALALLLFAGLLAPDIGPWTMVPPMLLLGAAYSIANIPRMNALLGSAPALYAGVASAANNASAQLGNALGIAVTVVLVTNFGRAQYFRGLTEAGADPEQITRATEILQEILRSDLPSIAARLAVPAERLQPLIGNYEAAFTYGIDRMFVGVAIGMLALALLTWVGLRPRR